MKPVLTVPAVIALLLAQAATAQDNTNAPSASAADDSNGLAEIVVTAQKRKQPLQDVPIAVSVVSGDTLARGGINDSSDLSQRLPDVKINSGGNSDFLNIRGVGSGQNPGFEQSVATFVDGVYRGRSRDTRAALFDVDQIEVLKGPQTTYFGNNAIAGALNIASKKPGRTLDYNFSAEGGSYGTFSTEGGVSIPLADTLAVRIAARYSGQDGYIKDDYTNQDSPRTRDAIGRISLAFTPSDNFQSNLRFDRERTREQGNYAVEILGCPAGSCNPALAAIYGSSFDDQLNLHSYAPESYEDYDMREAAWNNVWTLGQFSINALTSYFDHNFTMLTQQMPVPLQGVGGGGLLPVWVNETYNSYSQELRVQSTTPRTFEWMAGLYYMHGDLDTNLYTGFRFPVATPQGLAYFGDFLPGVYTTDSPITVNLRTQQIEQTKSAFAAGTLHFTSQFQVNLGARYSEVDKTAHRYIAFGTAGADPSTNFAAGPPIANTVYAAITGADSGDFPNPNRKDREFMPSIGAQYNFAADLMGYATYTRGFKAGGFGYSQLADTFGPETVNAYEIGLKSSWLEHRMTANVALFWSDYKNLQESATNFVNGNIVTVINNAAASRSRGIEPSLNWRVNSNLTLYTDLAYLDARYLNYPDASCTLAQSLVSSLCTQNISGKPRAYAPKYSGSLGATFTAPLGKNLQVRVDPLVYFTSWYYVTPTADPLLEQPGNAKFDLRLGIGPDGGEWEFAVVGKNLTNRLTANFRNSDSLPGSTYALTDPPRIIMAQFILHR